MPKVLIAFSILFLGIEGYGAAAQDNTVPKELVQYVLDARKAGLNEREIQQNAVSKGWAARAVTDAIASASATAPAKKPATDPLAAHPPGVAPGPAGSSGVPMPGITDSTIGQPQQPISRGVPDDYEIGSGDVLHVNVWGEPTASVNGAVVRTDGKISLPLIHDISVLGMSPAQAEKAIAEQLARFLNVPDVTVIVGSINSKKIYVTGQVKKEGTLPFTYRMTVMQAISEAGGLTPYAKRKKIYVLRNEDGRQFNLPFDYDAVLQGKHMEMNIPLKPGDQLIVP